MTDLADVSTLDLLAELDRRFLAAQPPRVEFFGVWPGDSGGHYRRDRYGNFSNGGRDGFPARGKFGLYPWDTRVMPRPEVEGKFWHWHHPNAPVTLLLSWDRSADHRFSSVATFIVHAHVTAEAGLALARADFPRVFERVEEHLGHAVELAGPAPEGAI